MFILIPSVVLCVSRSGEEDSGPAAHREEDGGVSRGRTRHRRLVPAARRPAAEGTTSICSV